MFQVVLIHSAHATRSPVQVSVGRFLALPPARTLTVKWQMGSNTGPKAHKERGFFLGFLLDFFPTMVGRSVSSHTASESNDVMFYLPGQAKCQGTRDRYKNYDF